MRIKTTPFPTAIKYKKYYNTMKRKLIKLKTAKGFAHGVIYMVVIAHI